MNIIAQSVSKTYKISQEKEIQVLKGISLEIPSNKISVIVGASGAGKSTLLHILGGLDKPDSGTVFVGDTKISDMNPKQMAKMRNNNIGFVFQFHHLLPEFTALENVAIPLMISGLSLKKASVRAMELLTMVGLSERATHKPAELSGGEQQRIALARALANDPPIILADEPTGNLDSANGEIVHNLIIQLRDEYNKTFVIVTHNKELVSIADVIFEIKDGNFITRS